MVTVKTKPNHWCKVTRSQLYHGGGKVSETFPLACLNHHLISQKQSSPNLS